MKLSEVVLLVNRAEFKPVVDGKFYVDLKKKIYLVFEKDIRKI